MPDSYTKDPEALLDYYIDWTAWLGDDTIATSTWSQTGTVTLSADAVLGGVTQIWVADGTLGECCAVTNHITTTAGRADDRSLLLVIRAR